MSDDITGPAYAYTDGHGHRIQLLTAYDIGNRPYVWVEAEDLAIGGAYASMWLTIEQVALMGDALDTRTSASFTDHTGDFLVIEPGDPHTVITVTRDPGDDDPGVVRVVVLTVRLPELRAALRATAERAQQRTAPAALSPTLAALRDIIAATPGRDGAELDAARVLLAAHAREMAEAVQDEISTHFKTHDEAEPSHRWRRFGMRDIRGLLHQYADDLDQQAAGGES